MNYKKGDRIKKFFNTYLITDIYSDHYSVYFNDKYGLMDKKTCKIVVKPIYFLIEESQNHYIMKSNEGSILVDKKTLQIITKPIYSWIFNLNKYYVIVSGIKLGLMDKKTGKVLLRPEYKVKYEELVKIYESKIRIEKLRQLEELIKPDITPA
jgi:hypothetical protein